MYCHYFILMKIMKKSLIDLDIWLCNKAMFKMFILINIENQGDIHENYNQYKYVFRNVKCLYK